MRNTKSKTDLCLIDATDTRYQLVITQEKHVKVYTMSLSALLSQTKLIARRLGLLTLVGCTVILASLFLTTLPAAARDIYVPFVSTDTVGSTGEDPVDCGLNAEEAGVADLMLDNSEQKRDTPVCDPVLAQVARARARDMALRGYFSHTNPDGNGPNLLARQAGFQLPDWYGSNQDSNNIESIGAGYTSSSSVWDGWINSPKHTVHVLGTESFYGDQDSYGIGYYFHADSPMQHYWVFISAPTP